MWIIRECGEQVRHRCDLAAINQTPDGIVYRVVFSPECIETVSHDCHGEIGADLISGDHRVRVDCCTVKQEDLVTHPVLVVETRPNHVEPILGVPVDVLNWSW